MNQDRYIAWLVRGILKPSRSGLPILEYGPNRPTTITWPGKRFRRSVKRHSHIAEHCQAVFGRKFPSSKDLLPVIRSLGFRALGPSKFVPMEGEVPSHSYHVRYNKDFVLLIRQYVE